MVVVIVPRAGMVFRVRGVALVRVAAAVGVAVRVGCGCPGGRCGGVVVMGVGVIMEDCGARESQQIAGQRDAGNQDSTTRTHRDTHPAGGKGDVVHCGEAGWEIKREEGARGEFMISEWLAEGDRALKPG